MAFRAVLAKEHHTLQLCPYICRTIISLSMLNNFRSISHDPQVCIKRYIPYPNEFSTSCRMHISEPCTLPQVAPTYLYHGQQVPNGVHICMSSNYVLSFVIFFSWILAFFNNTPFTIRQQFHKIIAFYFNHLQNTSIYCF